MQDIVKAFSIAHDVCVTRPLKLFYHLFQTDKCYFHLKTFLNWSFKVLRMEHKRINWL